MANPYLIRPRTIPEERPTSGDSVAGSASGYSDHERRSFDDHHTQDARRENEERHQRYLAACRMGSVEAQGVVATNVPDVSIMPVHAEEGPYQRQDTSLTDMSDSDSESLPPSLRGPTPGAYTPPQQQIELHQVMSGPRDASYNAASAPAAGVYVLSAPAVAAESAAASPGHGDASAPIKSAPDRQSPSPPVQQSPFETAKAQAVVKRPSMEATVAAAAARMSRKGSGGVTSGRLGSLGHTSRELHHPQMTKVTRSHNAASQLLAQPAQQLVLRFENVSSWADMGNLGAASKGPIDTVLSPVKGAASTLGKGAKRITSHCYKPTTHRGEGTARALTKQDIESGTIAPAVTAAPAGPPPTHAAGKGSPAPAAQGGRWRQILHGISGTVLPGQVLALMGPSGSGKTSLLSILGGRAPAKLKLEGSVTVNGNRLSKNTRRRIGFVLQDDVLYETLTVHETLTFSGLLRLPKTMTRAEKMDRIETVMAALGLVKARDTIIGGYFRRGVSGGERKRVSVGQELLINPSVLLLDEPTSGLDSTTALHLVQLLHELAGGGRAILTTIHQPSSRLYQHLDKVMLLAEGHVIYMGDALLAADWFAHLGFALPYGVNLADHLLDCAMGEVAFDPSAPGAPKDTAQHTQHAQHAGPLAEGTEHQGSDVARNSSSPHQQLIKSLHGKNAVHALYTTFESWYADHPAGFTFSSLTDPNKPSVTDADSSNGRNGSATNGYTLPGAAMLKSADSGAMLAALLDGVTLKTPTSHHYHRQSLQGKNGGAAVGAESATGAAAVTTRVAGPGAAGGGEVITARVGRWLQRRRRGSKQVGPADPEQGVSAHGEDGKGGINEKERTTTADDTPWFEQVGILLQRAIKVRRFESLSGQQLAQIIAVACITGLLWWQRARTYDVANGADITGLLFFEMVFVSFRSLFQALFTFPNEFRILSKERPSGAPRLSAYYVARTLADVPIEILFPTIFIIIVYFFGGLRLSAGAFFSNWLSVLLIVFVAQSWGLLIGGTFMDPKTAQTVTTVIILTLMLVGGYYVRDVPVWIGWLKYLSFLYWGNNLLLKIQFRGKSLTDCASALPGQPCPTVPSVQDALRLPIDPNQGVYPEVLVLLAMLAILRVATWYVLRWKVAGSQRHL